MTPDTGQADAAGGGESADRPGATLRLLLRRLYQPPVSHSCKNLKSHFFHSLIKFFTHIASTIRWMNHVVGRRKVVKKRQMAVIAGVGLVIGAGMFGLVRQGRNRQREAMAAQEAQIETVQVKRQNLIDSVSVTGTIESADARKVSASAKDVKVQEVRCQVGDYVNAGDVVVVLDTSSLERSLEEARNRQALSTYTENKSIETASENYAEAVEDGTDAYNKAVKSEAQAKEDLKEADGDLNEAAERLKRREERVAEAKEALNGASVPAEPSGESSEEEQAAYQAALEVYQQLEKAYEEAQASYTEAHQAYQAAEQADEKAQEAYETASEALTEEQKKNDRNIADAEDGLEKAQMEHSYSNDSSEQTIENYEEQIASCTVTSPISGIITAMQVEAGDTYLGEGNILFEVADQEHFVVSASVDEYEISKLKKGMEAAVIVEAIGEEELPAKVSFVSPTAASSDTGSASYQLEIGLDEANQDLRIGMTAKASVVLRAAYEVLTVPYDCVETDVEGNSSVYIDKNGEKVQVPVEVGMEGDYDVEVSGEEITEDTMVYYSTPMLAGDGAESLPEAGEEFQMPMGGGTEPVGPGGAPRGGPGGF